MNSLLIGTLATFALAWSGAARADAAGDAALAAVDAATNKAATLRQAFDAVVRQAGKPDRTIAFEVLAKGAKRRIDFLAPDDTKGTQFLIASPTEIWAKLPAFENRVRRIAANVAGMGGLMGMSFNLRDVATTAWAPAYTGQIAADGEKEITLALTAKADAQAPYPKVEVVVTKERMLPREIRSFNAGGRLVKSETRAGYTCEGEVCTPGEVTVVDHLRGELTTKLTRKSVKVNEPIDDAAFQVGALRK